jgi:hypothetical protein
MHLYWKSCLSIRQVALDVHQAEPGQVCVWGHIGQAVGFPGFIQGDRAEPGEDQDNRSDVTSCLHQGCAEAHRVLGFCRGPDPSSR